MTLNFVVEFANFLYRWKLRTILLVNRGYDGNKTPILRAIFFEIFFEELDLSVCMCNNCNKNERTWGLSHNKTGSKRTKKRRLILLPSHKSLFVAEAWNKAGFGSNFLKTKFSRSSAKKSKKSSLHFMGFNPYENFSTCANNNLSWLTFKTCPKEARENTLP